MGKVRTLVTRDRLLDIGMILQERNMDKESAIIQTSTMNFSMWNVCVRENCSEIQERIEDANFSSTVVFCV